MSVYRRMMGRELPCGVLQLLHVPLVTATAARLERLVELAGLGQADAHELCELGRGYLARGQWGLARKYLIESLLRRPGFVLARLSLAGACDLLGRCREAAEHVDTVLAVMLGAGEQAAEGWSQYELLCAAGFCLERAGDFRQAQARYALALASAPTDLFAAHRQVAVCLAHGQADRAAEALRHVVRHQPQDQAARICLGHVLQQLRRPAQAVWEYEQALCLEPDGWEMPAEAGSLVEAVDSEAMIGALERLVGAQPHFPDLRMRLANLYSWRGDDELARDQYGKALALHPEYLDCHIAIARHELRMGREDAAAEHFRHAIAINDQNVEACAALSLALRRAHLHQRAAEMLASAARIAANSAVLMAQLAMIESGEPHVELDDQWIGGLIERDRMLLAAHPGWSDVRLRLAMVLRLAGKLREARQAMETLVARDGSRTGWLLLGLARARRGFGRSAAEALARALKLDRHAAETEWKLALCCCDDLGFDLAMERTERDYGVDTQRRVWMVLDAMRLTGLSRDAHHGGRTDAGKMGIATEDQ